MVEKAVTSDSWKKIPRYTDYPYIAAVPIEKARSDMFPYTEFAQNEAESGNYAEICESFNGGVYLFAKEPPEKDITVKIHLFRGGI